ncbi:hypothetical protein Bbelb_417420 [Branchiostoma belcheri]|nr:hypothetical protein Bbelb_417420 [Branchiostoma belcheri]
MPPDPPTLLAPLALDSRFCARLRAPSALPSQNPLVKLGRLKKCKQADVDSDTPVFVDALGDQGRAESLLMYPSAIMSLCVIDDLHPDEVISTVALPERPRAFPQRQLHAPTLS